ncbi:MAG: hypothetical protein K0R86_735 [Enterobacter kobei]|nr:hypothetical protein [Enterobacter kobei]
MTNQDNKLSQYPRPPFPEQPQQAPGLASEMKPIPDHGETRYIGSGRLAGKKALITGGDSGIGRAVAIAYAREGADVAINYLPEEESDAEAVIALIQAEGRIAVALPGDIRSETFCQQLVVEAINKLGGLDILVNNAGRQQFCGSIEDLTTEAFDDTFKTNVYAPFWITKAAVPHLKEGAVIINTSSVAVAPGPYWTPLQSSGGQPQEKVKAFGESAPLGRPGQPVEIAPLYVLFASDESSFASGQVWCSDGGTGTV